MEVVPIDIHITKLPEWLISRRHCKNNWQSQIDEIRTKINAALEDMPEHTAIAELLSGSYINYFTCCEIIEILKETEADSKNVFGMYGSKRMKDWQDIVRLYQKDNVYLAEVANILLRIVKYEIPGVRKQIVKYKQMQQECDRKITDYAKNAISAQKELETWKKQLGITGDKVRIELLKRTLYLDEIYKNIISNVKALEKSVNYYSKFSHFVVGVKYTLTLISYIIEKGNTTTYEWLYGKPPRKIELEDVKKLIEESEKLWEIEEIDWNIDLVDGANNVYGITTVDESVIEEDCTIQDSTVARGQNAFSVLDNPNTRNEFLSQLLELQSFLKMRLLESRKGSDELFIIDENVRESSENIAQMLGAVQIVKQLMMDPINQQLHFIKHSNRYIDKMTTLFHQKVNSIEKTIATREALKNRKEELIDNEAQTRPKLALLMEKTRLLQAKVESEISKKYINRPVHLIGGF